MNKNQLSHLLDRYFNGTCTIEEKQLIDNWFELYKDKPGFTGNLSNNNKEQLKHRMFSAISDHVDIHDPKIPVTGSWYKSWWIRVAAAAMLLVFAKVLIIDKILTTGKPAQTAIAEIVITNRTKNIIRQQLPDSSIVWLSPNANLSYPKTFRAASRTVAMQGECFFEVTKNPQRPFIINSEHMVTRVWGTSFRVLDVKNMLAAKVTVVTGKVSVSKKGDQAGPELLSGEVMLLPKQEVVYHKNTDLLVASRQADISALNIYKHVDLSFENARLTEIVNVLNKKFEANIRIKDEALNKAVMTADLTGLNLPEVLEVLKTSMKLNYEIVNDLIVLTKTN